MFLSPHISPNFVMNLWMDLHSSPIILVTFPMLSPASIRPTTLPLKVNSKFGWFPAIFIFTKRGTKSVTYDIMASMIPLWEQEDLC